MFSAGVVETFDVLKDGIGDVHSRSPGVSPDQFGFEGFEKGFDGGIVITVPYVAHRDFEAQLTQPLLIVMGTILTASVSVMNATLWWVAKRHRIVQGLQCQVTFQAIADGPTDDPARMQINHHCQVQSALSCPDIGDVTCPLLIWLISMEVPVQPVWRNVEVVIAVGGRLVFTGSDDTKAVQTHQTAHATVTNPQTYFLQLLSHSWPPIAAEAQVMLFPDMGQQHHVVTLTLADWAVPPSPKAT